MDLILKDNKQPKKHTIFLKKQKRSMFIFIKNFKNKFKFKNNYHVFL